MILRVTLIVIILAIAYLSFTPTDTITIGNDKISHFIAYGTLMFNAGLLTRPSRKRFVLAIGLCVIYGALIEVGQYYVPGRVMSPYDLVANIGGVAMGAAIVLLFHRKLRRFLKWTKNIQ